jgi:hypothetical protein
MKKEKPGWLIVLLVGCWLTAGSFAYGQYADYEEEEGPGVILSCKKGRGALKCKNGGEILFLFYLIVRFYIFTHRAHFSEITKKLLTNFHNITIMLSSTLRGGGV